MKNIKLTILFTILLSASICVGETFRLASFNMAFCRDLVDYEIWQARKDLPMQVVKKYDFDICAVQEPYAFQVKYLATKAPEYALVGEPFGNDTPEKFKSRPKKFRDRFTILSNMNNPIWYKRDKFDLLDKGIFWYSDTPQTPHKNWNKKVWDSARSCEWAKFRCKKTNTAFYVFNTHLQVPETAEKLASTKLLLKKVDEISKGESFFICGDFNMNETSPNFKYLANSNKMKLAKNIAKKSVVNAKDSYVGFEGKGGSKPTGIIDHIFVSNNVKVEYFELVEYKNKDVYPSDHLPIFVDVCF